jgi:hypothetical protein
VTRQAAEASGRVAETIAANYLRLKGWTILARHVRTPAGEADIAMRRPGIMAFIERIRPPSICRSIVSGWYAWRQRQKCSSRATPSPATTSASMPH